MKVSYKNRWYDYNKNASISALILTKKTQNFDKNSVLNFHYSNFHIINSNQSLSAKR